MEPIKILVIDDEQSEGIKENLSDFLFHNTGCSIDTADSIEIALDKIKTGKKDKLFYDIMIIDMKLSSSENNEGMDILKIRPSCIKIVLTAHTSIQNCIECFKEGVFDYIDKSSHTYDPYVRLKESMRIGLEERLKEKEIPFLKWIRENYNGLKKEYGGKYIAVIDDVVVDSDEHEHILRARFKEKYPFYEPSITNITGDRG